MVETQRYTLWGSAHSLYTGKLRSYLIKKGLPYRERYPSDPDFGTRILPVVRHFVIPVLETPEGAILQDTGDIIDALEARHAAPSISPETPVLTTISMLLDAFGSEYLLPLAMHYRWTYRADQDRFLCAEFGRTMHANVSREERLGAASKTMDYFAGFLPNLGVRPATVPAMEASYLELIDALDAHFQYHPYLLGGRPSLGDFGMMAPLFAHLGRDPVPAGIMKRHAPNLFRWTERMNIAQISDGEYPGYDEHWPADDTVPETLVAVLKLVFRDWTPGLLADAECFADWARDKPAGALVSREGQRQVHPTIGRISYPWHGVEMERASAPHGLWHFVKAADFARGLNGADRARLDALLDLSGGHAIMAIEPSHRMTRMDNVLVLA
jgi:glutathione S-transferase